MMPCHRTMALGLLLKGPDAFESRIQLHLGYPQGQTDYYNRTVPSCAPALCFYRANCKGTFHRPKCSETKTCPPAKCSETAASVDSGMASSRLADTLKMLTCLASRLFCGAECKWKALVPYFVQQLFHIPLQLPTDPKHAEVCQHVCAGNAEVNRTVLCAMASRLDEFMGEMTPFSRRPA